MPSPESDQERARQQALACCRLGLERRGRGERPEAGRAFLEALQHWGECELALRALEFQAIGDGEVQELLPRLEPLVHTGWIRHPRGRLLLADWQHRCGDRAAARRLYRGLWAADRAAAWPDSEPESGPQESGRAAGPLAERRPEALLIGAPKSGTTSLMAYLGGHPEVWSTPRKELHFFNNRWHWGPHWYADQFPTRREVGAQVRLEGTPDYLQDPRIPERVRQTLPGVKLIVLLREPLARALSWLEHQRRWAGLQGSSEALLDQEARDLSALQPEELRQLGWRAPNALAGSLYDLQLRRWRGVVPDGDLLLLRFEDLCSDPRAVTCQAVGFLGVDPERLPAGMAFPRLNPAPQPYAGVPPAQAQRLRHTLLRGAHRLWSGL